MGKSVENIDKIYIFYLLYFPFRVIYTVTTNKGESPGFLKEENKMREYLDEAKTIPVHDYGCEITREDFEAHFKKTKEKVTFSFGGWDGKSYDGESRRATVYISDIPELKGCRFVKVGKGLHEILEDEKVLEKATGKYNLAVFWKINVAWKK